jgi:hypothetical protein
MRLSRHVHLKSAYECIATWPLTVWTSHLCQKLTISVRPKAQESASAASFGDRVPLKLRSSR